MDSFDFLAGQAFDHLEEHLRLFITSEQPHRSTASSVDEYVRHLIDSSSSDPRVQGLLAALRRNLTEFVASHLADSPPKDPAAVQEASNLLLKSPELLAFTSAASASIARHLSSQNVSSRLSHPRESSTFQQLAEDLGDDSYYGILPAPHELEEVCTYLRSDVPAVRIQALQHLVGVSPSELMLSQHWPHIMSCILDMMMDRDSDVSSAAVSFIAQAANSQEDQAITPLIEMTCTCIAEIGVKNIQNCVLLHQLLLFLPQKWMRLQKQKLVATTALVIKTLLSWSAAPLHVIALLDPTAEWFERWIHGRSGRVFFEDTCRAHPELLQALLSLASVSASRPEVKLPCPLPCSAHVAQHALQLHVSSVLLSFAKFSECRRLFQPTNQREVGVGLAALVKTILAAAFHSSSPRASFTTVYGLGRTVAGKVKEMMSWNDRSRQTLMTGDCVPVLLQTHVAAMRAALAADAPLSTCVDWDTLELQLVAVADICGLMASTPAGAAHLVQCSMGLDSPLLWPLPTTLATPQTGQSAHVLEIRTVFHVLAAFTCQLVAEAPQHPEGCGVAAEMLVPLRQVQNSGLLANSDVILSLCPFVSHALEVLPMSRSLCPLREACLDFLVNVMHTSIGVMHVMSAPSRGHVLEWIASRFADGLQVGKFEKFGFGTIFCELSLLPSGIEDMRASGIYSTLQEGFISSCCNCLDYELPFGHLSGSRRCYGYGIKCLSGHAAIHAMCTSKDTMYDFVTQAAFATDAGPWANPEQVEMAVLDYLLVATQTATGALLLQAHAGATERLAQQQRTREQRRDSDGNIVHVISQPGLLRSRLLGQLSRLGGPSERELPDWDASESDVHVEPTVAMETPRGGTTSEQLARVIAAPASTSWRINACTAVLQSIRSEAVCCSQLAHIVCMALASDATAHVCDDATPVRTHVSVTWVDMLTQYASRLGLHVPRDRLEAMSTRASAYAPDWAAGIAAMIASDLSIAHVLYARLRPSACMQASSLLEEQYSHAVAVFDVIVRRELPAAVNALQQCGLTPSRFAMFWLEDFFVNALDWDEIVCVTALAVLLDPAWPIIQCVLMLESMTPVFVRMTNADDVTAQLSRVSQFRIASRLDRGLQLLESHRALLVRYVAGTDDISGTRRIDVVSEAAAKAGAPVSS